ncbi:hypothetical protein [Streptomyces sp. AP-93]|uniref:hypothetical protein n=1 Tax=Streptomyces sp. AP-93 TaxID=2929048 RepID=UPI001FAFFCAE|nr:hypothetical protein [Streptomyces sp. AP-93]MCJ0868101.1 hypothetical protein [Streptomyces sp. AP-93]
MKLPRAACPICEKPVSLLPTRRSGHGSLHDHKRNARALVLCEGSMTHVPYGDAVGWQETLPEDADRAVAPVAETLALF